MKKISLTILAFLCLASYARAGQESWNYVPRSSYTDASTPGPILFTSAVIQFVGVTISSPFPNSYLAFYRSTNTILTPELATQTIINTDYLAFNSGPTFIPLFEMRNASCTLVSKVGNAKITLWFHLPNSDPTTSPGFPGPGLMYSGQR